MSERSGLPEQVRVLVIGGGIAGCSVLYHLARLGWSEALLVERGELTSGSTWHSVGNTPMFATSLNTLRLLKYSNELYGSLEAETGQGIGYHRVGSLRLATNPDLVTWYKEVEAMARLAGVDAPLISTREALELNPIFNPEAVLAVSHLYGDGYLDPSGVTHALAQGARQRGAHIARQTRVRALRATASGDWEVETDRGPVRAEVVVNAAGQWGREVGRMAGVELPLVPVEHQYVVTEPVQRLKTIGHEIPVTRDPERVFYMRQEGEGLLFGFFEENPIPWAVDGIPADFGQQLLPERIEHLAPHLERAVERVPLLAQVGLARIVNGPDAYTPDGAPLVGPVPGTRNFYVIAGFSLFGIANAGGTGRALAEWIVEGAPGVDMWAYDARRYGDYAARKSFLVPKAEEAYALDYAIHYPHRERTAGRPVKTSPIHDLLAAQGAVFAERHGWERPLWFAPEGVPARDELGFGKPNWFPYVAQECKAVRERVGILDQTSFGKFEVSGPGAVDWLNWMCANQINVPVGRIVVTQMLNARGGIECDLTVTRVGNDRFWIVTAAATTTHDYSWMEAHRPRDGRVSLRDMTGEYAVLSLMGPRARSVLQQLTDADVSNAGFPFLAARELTIGAAPVRAYRVSYVGELGYELYHPLPYQRQLYHLLMDAGRDLGIVNFGYRALDSLRMEKGYRFWGFDMNALSTPREAGMMGFVRLNKGEFQGRAALVEGPGANPTRALVSLAIEGDYAVPHGWEPLYNGADVVGYVASGEQGHSVGCALALAYLPPELSKPGTQVELELHGERHRATIVQAPVYDPKNEKLRA